MLSLPVNTPWWEGFSAEEEEVLFSPRRESSTDEQGMPEIEVVRGCTSGGSYLAQSVHEHTS